MNEPWFGVLLVVAGLALLVATLINFRALVHHSGLLSHWAMLVPPTRVGLSAVALFLVLLGVQIIRYAAGHTSGRTEIAFLMAALLAGGLLHDTAVWVLASRRARRNGP